MDGDQRRDVHQQAAARAARRIERFFCCTGLCALGRLDQAFHRLHAARADVHLGLRQQQPGTGLDQVSGERGQPPLYRRCLAAQAGDRVKLPLDQPRGPGHLPGGHRVPDRVLGQPVVFVPGGRVTVQLRYLAGLFLLQAGAEQVGEQVVVAPPAADLIQRHQEQPGPLDLLQQRLAPGPAGDRVAQRTGQPFQHRGLQQEGAHLLGLALEHLLGQVVQDVPVAAGERGHEPGDVRLAAQRQRGQLQPGCPAFGPRGQRRHICSGQRHVGYGGHLPQQRRGLLNGELQLSRAELGQLPAGPTPGQRQRRVAAAGQHQAQPRRPVLQQEPQRVVYLPGADHVVIVEDQQRLAVAGPGGQIVDQRCDEPLERGRRRGPGQRANPPGDSLVYLVQGGQHMTPEPDRVVVTGIQRQPRGRTPAVPGPVGQQDRLAVSGRRADQDQPLPESVIEPFRQART